MRGVTAWITGGVVLMLAGMVWMLQGIGLLPGSFMSGQSFWAWAGLASFIAGLVLTLVGLGRRARS
ncbi:MAG TPA: hypothetical protein VGE45_18120 [Chloroflexia bacterium]